MKKFIGVAVVVAALVPAGAAISGGQPDWSLQVRGFEAMGGGWFEGECTFGGVDFGGAAETVRQVNGQPVKVNGSWAGMWQFNFCDGVETYGWGFVEGGFSGNLTGATIAATFDVFSYRFSWDGDEPVFEDLGMGTATLSATLTGEGDTMSGLSHQINRWGRNMSKQRLNGQFRMASAAVSLTVDGATVPVSFASGQLAKVNFGSMEMFEN